MGPSSIPAHGGERVAAALAANGVRVVFTLCGGHISPILVASKRLGIRIVDTRDEATAVFAADAVARLTGTPGTIRFPGRRLGQDNEELYQELLGIGAEELDKLRAEGVL